ncbi:NADP-dependent oxidoreductase [Dactylosporangium sp. NPDC051484]|uniref:NADP-dependent oxidoreductase n=1 Tax=Dactylosporangium sp. NPDC051484 TaxID=3154942 RepID=UPI00344D434E
MKAVRFDEYGGIDVLQVADVPVPEPGQGQVLVEVKAASINPGEAKIRDGSLQAIWPATFPSGEGTDLAGIVTKVGPGVEGIAAGDEVIGFTDERASHAEYVVVPARNLTAKPANVSWEVGGSLGVAGSTAYAAVRAVSVRPGDTVAVTGAAGGVGSMAVQLARRAGAEVIGIAGPDNRDWLTTHSVTPVAYGAGLTDKLRETPIDAFIDTHGDGYVRMAVELGVAPERIDTIIDFPAVEEYGVKAEGSESAMNTAVMAELAALASSGDLDVPIAAVFPLDDVRAAFEQLERGHTRGKIVLRP